MATDGTTAEADEFWLFGYGSLIWKPPPHFDRRIPGWVTGYVRRFWQASQDHRGTPEAPGRVVTLISRSYWEQLVDHHDSAPDKVWGVAYRIKADRVAEVKEYLDIREINGYTIHYTPFYPAPGVDPALLPQNHHHDFPFRTLVYIGTPDNEQFVGPQDPQKLAEHIYRSSGPSGLNRDYLWGLEAALGELSPESGDEHVTDLANRVRAIAAREEKKNRGEVKEVEGIKADRTEEEKEAAAPPPSVIVRNGTTATSPEHLTPSVLQREQQHHEQPHNFRNAGDVDEQEETEKTS
ncbi:ChaC-like protein-domain-containing protein, partial [Thermothelomyces heterothallicus CBS 202.75]|uniref:ChaC-like protein-domain-containing protein n=1 Tax=Thermothelomyces heterothallicus CBS 202.75 TaxID=1149848 RepID=UPI0037426E94